MIKFLFFLGVVVFVFVILVGIYWLITNITVRKEIQSVQIDPIEKKEENE